MARLAIIGRLLQAAWRSVHPVDRDWLILGGIFVMWAPLCVCVVAWIADR